MITSINCEIIKNYLKERFYKPNKAVKILLSQLKKYQ